MDSFAEGYAVGRDANGSNNGGWGDGNGFLWIIALAILFGRNGFGGFGGGGGCCQSACATQADLANGFAQNTLQRGIDDIILGQANAINYNNQGFAGLNNAINQQFAGVDNAICTLGYNQATLINGLSRELGDCLKKSFKAIKDIFTKKVKTVGSIA